MIIKKYIVNDMKEAITRAKYELGQEAIIISERKVKIGKWYNPFKTSKLEVTVALEESKKIADDFKVEIPIVKLDDPLSKSIEAEVFYEKASDKLKSQLVSYCKLHSKSDHKLSRVEIKDFLNAALKDNCFEKKLDLSRINVMIGPTGVGKTTTIAKIAAKEYLVNKKKVGLITMDTYRIGAVEQLKTYANILDIPFEVVNKPSEMIEKIEKLKDCEIILIDTLGTSPENKNKIEEIGEYFLDIEEQINTYLVISSTTERQTTLNILEKYKQLNYDALILTKLDEANMLANFWCIIENNTKPVQFLCVGQDVPDDIQLASLDNIFDYYEENYKHD